MANRSTRGVALIEIVVVVMIIAIVVFFLLPIRMCPPDDTRKTRCMVNLRQLGIALELYVQGPGGGKYYPYPTQDGNYLRPNGNDLARGKGFSGASFLASLYWSGVLTEPNVFICPATADDNRRGRDLGTNPTGEGGKPNVPGWSALFEKPNGSHISYASKAQWTMPRGEPLERPMLRPDSIMATDDTDGTPNHSDGTCVLYGDTHVDFVPAKK